jgi:hypothetical protein
MYAAYMETTAFNMGKYRIYSLKKTVTQVRKNRNKEMSGEQPGNR